MSNDASETSEVAVRPMGSMVNKRKSVLLRQEVARQAMHPGLLAVDGEDEEHKTSMDGGSRAIGKNSCFKFVEAGWFLTLSAGIIVLNTILYFAEAEYPAIAQSLWVPEQVCLVFYVFELMCRACFFGRSFLCSSCGNTFVNMLDVVVVVAGIMDQWVLKSSHAELPMFRLVLQLLRLARGLKILRVFVEADLRFTGSETFQSFMGGVIVCNAVIMGLETDIAWEGWFYVEQVMLGIYVLELVARLKRAKWDFFCNEDIIWNWFDFCLVFTSAIDSWLVPAVLLLTQDGQDDEDAGKKAHAGKTNRGIGQWMMLLRMLRLLRVLRLVRLVKAVRPLFNLVMGILSTMQGIGWVLLLTIVTLYAMGITATRLIGHGAIFTQSDGLDHWEVIKPFASVPDSMFILFKIMNGAQSGDDARAIDELMVQVPAVKFAFVFFMITSSWTLLSILTAVVSDNMISTTAQQEQQLNMEQAEEKHAKQILALEDLFGHLDGEGDGTVNERELTEYLSDRTVRSACARACHLSAPDLIQVLRFLAMDGERVPTQKFIEVLAYVGKPVSERSVMKLEACLNGLQRRQEFTEASLGRLATQLCTLEWRSGKGAEQIASRIRSIEQRQESFRDMQERWQAQQEAHLEKQGQLLHQVLQVAGRGLAPNLLPQQQRQQQRTSPAKTQ